MNEKWPSSENREIRATNESATIERETELSSFFFPSRINTEGTSEMRDEMTMYALKPIVSLPGALAQTKTMYEMRNIHGGRSTDGDHTGPLCKNVPDITEQVISFLKSPLPEYNALEVRQEKILTQLAELKQQVSMLSQFLKETNQTAVDDQCCKSQPVNVKLIINANPKKPPYSISAMQKLWEDVDIKVETHVHSSISEEGPVVHRSVSSYPNSNIINLLLIWKDVEDLELVSGLHNYHVTGETNFLRYISRLLSSRNYENSICPQRINTADSILDLCHSLHFQESSAKKQEILRLIANKLDSDWFGKEKPNIADIAAWCTIKQVFSEKCPPKLRKWYEACEKLFV
ncbi:putative aminoacyl tRNA synthase complex-interacting multifunctional protein 2 isoform X2 [Andrena cerasifolii]|uniref:putative aminoacyl tRNA synthase complex-interacting multifunctional protein 2 isoform X2 n=1 Tax=Andrena cerasifolii TaxID=2819439 RepID=UPI004037F763